MFKHYATIALLTSALALAANTKVSDKGQSRITKEVRHELVTLPQYGIFDNLAFKVDNGGTVTLMGATTQPVLKTNAENAVKDIEGVTKVVNNIEVLPVSPNDDNIRLGVYRAVYGQSALSRYQLQSVPSIHIVVKNGDVALEGFVATEADRNIAGIQAKGVSGVHNVTNNLRTDTK